MQQLLPFRFAVPAVVQARVLAVCFGGAVPVVAAADPAWSFSGFGTLSALHASQHKPEFTSSVLRDDPAGPSQAWSGDADSRLGAQIDLAPGQRWSAVLQLVSEQQFDHSYRPVVEWANVKWQATPELALRAGRIALPLFLGSDCRKVGYIYPWARPPVKAYGAIPLSSSDGVDLAWRWEALGLRHSTQAFYGNRDVRLTDTMRLSGSGIAGIVNTMHYGAASARLSAMSAGATLDGGNELPNALGAFGPRGQALRDKYRVHHQHLKVLGVGVDYDPGDWFVTAEANQLRTHTFLGKASGLNASTGYRWGTLTPWVAYTRIRADSAAGEPGLPLAGLAPDAAQTAAGLNAGMDAMRKVIPQQSTVGAGLRWDFRRDFALKVEYQRVTPYNGARGAVLNPQSELRPGEPIEVAIVALDLVF
jgi:hypothetical protein